MTKNILGTELMPCSIEPLTGFYRDACCNTGPEDLGRHVVCAEMTDDFLRFSASVGNDLTTPRLEYGFPGLVAGDRWCLCAARWQEALSEGAAPSVILQSTHELALEHCRLADLKDHEVG